MKFIKLLKEQDHKNYIKTKQFMEKCNMLDFHVRMTKPIVVGDYKISVQASWGHHSEPQENLPYDKYKRMEFAILGELDFIGVERFSSFEKYKELTSYSDKKVCHYVPVELMEQFFDYLEELGKYDL